MEESAPVSQRTRVIFALVGAVTCLAAACLAELALGRMNAGNLLRKYHAASILFLTDPATTFTKEEPPPPAPPPSDYELQRRLDKVGGQSGDVQISLTWNNRNDLDLSCVDPYGEMIDGYNQQSRSGGVIDVDMNVTPGELLSPQANALVNRRFGVQRQHRTGISSEPVENLIWANNAPQGHYKVFVHQFCNKEQTASTPYWVVVRVHGEVHRITGVMGREDFCQQLVEPKLVYEFDVTAPKPAAPVVEKAPPAPKPMQPPPPPKLVRHVAYSLNHLDYALLTALLWGTLAGLLPIALVIAQRIYLGLPALYGEPDLIVGIGGPATGFAAALIAQTVLSLLASAFAPSALPALFVFSWMLLGALFAGALSFYTPNLPRIAAWIAGTASALMGSSLFLLLASSHQDSAGRVLIATLVGGTIGALIALPRREREPEPEPVPEQPRPAFEVAPPFVVRGTRTRKVGGLRRTDDP
jgi:hypothetical protein